MRHFMKRIALFTLTILMLGSALPAATFADVKTEPAFAAELSPEGSGITYVASSMLKKINYALKVWEFLKDKRFKNGISWGNSKRPNLSSHSCSGCMAYAVDFCKYVYGADWASNPEKFTKYTDVSKIATGDAIRINGHYFVVLKREGNKLYTAEGNYSSKVRASLTTYGYCIDGNQLYQIQSGSSKVKVTFKTGYRFQ